PGVPVGELLRGHFEIDAVAHLQAEPRPHARSVAAVQVADDLEVDVEVGGLVEVAADGEGGREGMGEVTQADAGRHSGRSATSPGVAGGSWWAQKSAMETGAPRRRLIPTASVARVVSMRPSTLTGSGPPPQTASTRADISARWP